MKPRVNIAISLIFLLLAAAALILVFVKGDFSTYGILLIASAIALIALFTVNIVWTARNIKNAASKKRDNTDKTSPEEEQPE